MRHLIPALLFVLSLPAAAQKILQKPATFEPGSIEDRAQQRCRANRGSDCDTRQGLSEWIRQERPLTPEEQQAAAGARRHRDECARNGHKAGC